MSASDRKQKYVSALIENEHLRETVHTLSAEIARLNGELPQKHPASDPPRHPNWVIVCIEGDIFPAIYVFGKWWEDMEYVWNSPLPTPDWWCELPYKF